MQPHLSRENMIKMSRREKCCCNLPSVYILYSVLPSVCSSSARGFETAELQIPGGAQSVEGAQQLRDPADRSPLQGNVSTEQN